MNITEHLLTCLAEECVEVAKDCTKSLRFGLTDTNVANPTGPNNAQRIVEEMNDLLAIVDMLVERGALPENWQDRHKQYLKKKRVIHFMDYAKNTKALQGVTDFKVLQTSSFPPTQRRTDSMSDINTNGESPASLSDCTIRYFDAENKRLIVEVEKHEDMESFYKAEIANFKYQVEELRKEKDMLILDKSGSELVSRLSHVGYSCLDTLQEIVARLGGSKEVLICIASLGNSHSDEGVLEELQYRLSLLPQKEEVVA